MIGYPLNWGFFCYLRLFLLQSSSYFNAIIIAIRIEIKINEHSEKQNKISLLTLSLNIMAIIEKANTKNPTTANTISFDLFIFNLN